MQAGVEAAARIPVLGVQLSGLIVLIIALLLLVVLAVGEGGGLFRFDRREYRAGIPAGEAVEKLVELLKARGFTPMRLENDVAVEDVFRVELHAYTPADSSSTRILWQAGAPWWLLAIIILLFALNVGAGLVGGVLAYLKYRDVVKAVEAALAELGAERVV